MSRTNTWESLAFVAALGLALGSTLGAAMSACGIQTGGCFAVNDADPNGTPLKTGSFPTNTKNLTGTVRIENVGGYATIYLSNLQGVTETTLRLDATNNVSGTVKLSLKGCTGNQRYDTSIGAGTGTWTGVKIVNPLIAPPNDVYVDVPL